MTDVRSPARPWFDLVTQEIAVRGWGIAELARRAKVGRPTIYGWRDSAGKPQSGPVNAVADTLGIDRKRANELAGIIPRTEPARREPDIPADVLAVIRKTYPPDKQQQVIEALEAIGRRDGPSAAEQSPGSPRRTA